MGRGAAALAAAVRRAYEQDQTDYSMEPLVLTDGQGNALGRIRDGDSVVFCCRRGEREIQLTEAFADPALNRFPRQYLPDLKFVILTLYHEKFRELPVAFAPSSVTGTLGEVVSRAGLRQLRVAESEKYAHVTYFFNGGRNGPFPGEDGARVPSPRGIPFDQIPEMSLPGVVAEIVRGCHEGYDLIVANFANGDVIGHTPNRAARIRCAELIDSALGRVVPAALSADYVVAITADHGLLEDVGSAAGPPRVSHTTNPVPLVLLDPRAPSLPRPCDGRLADVAPTILVAMGLARPPAMTGTNLAPAHKWGGRRRVLLIVLDGWGMGEPDETNPISLAATPFLDEVMRGQAPATLEASGEAVGLGTGKAGNSEAGHMNIGAGRVVLQDDVRLDTAMGDGSFQANSVLLDAIRRARDRGAALHLIGLLTEKSSHGSVHYPLAILEMARREGLDRVALHMILDGRSTEPGSAPALLERLEEQVGAVGIGRVVTCMGRGIALDRDGNYEKTRRAYDALVEGAGAGWPAPACVGLC